MEQKEKAIKWFENIAAECDMLTTGNVAHLKAQIKGMAIRSAEYLKKHALVSEDLDEAAMMHFKDVLERKIKTGLETANMTSFKAGALWQKAQDKETIELAEDHAMLAGMNKMEEDMMAKACKFLQEEVLDDYPGVVWEGIIEDFKNYMKGE